MTTATAGIARALSRARSGTALADLTPEEIFAGLTAEQRAGLQARWWPRSAGSLRATEAGATGGAAPAPHAARLAEPEFAAGFREASVRAAAVLAHPAARGRGRAVAAMLKTDLGADDIIAALEGRVTAEAATATAGRSSWSRAVARANQESGGAG